MKIKSEYVILKAESDGRLENLVRSFLEKGWQLQGGVSISVLEPELSTGNGYCSRQVFAQAMTKQTEQDERP